jgi:hypothetical protein
MPDQAFTQVSYTRRDEAGWITLDPPWEQTLESHVAQFRRARGSADMREGIRACTDRREAEFAR